MKKHYYLSDILQICNHKHLSAEDIFLLLKKKYPRIAKGSVYRNLDKLVEQKKLNKIKALDNKTLYEWIITPHIHFICQKTGVVTDIPFDLSILKIPLPKWYVLDYVDIVVYWNKE